AARRTAPRKGFDLLIAAFTAVAPARPEWDLVIFGEGSERAMLTERIARAGLAGRAFLPGAVPGPGEAFSGADLFVLSSRYEGFPNALCEALASGLPAVAFDCPNGPSEIVRDGVDGRLVPAESVPDLAAGILELTGDAGLRARMAARGPEIAERLSVDRVADSWAAILRSGAGAPA